MLVVLARHTNPEVVGEFSLALAVTAPIILFTNLKLRSVQATDALGQYSFEQYFALRVMSLPIALVAITAVVLFAQYDRTIGLVVLLVAFSKCVEATSDIIFGHLQLHERMDRIALSMIVKGVVSLAVFSFLVYETNSLIVSLVGLIASWMMVLLFFDVPNAKKELYQDASQHAISTGKWKFLGFRPDWNSQALVSLTVMALPLAGTTLLGSLSTAIPRISLERSTDAASLGVFSAMAYVLVAGGLVINALGQSATPRLSKLYANAEYAAFKRLLLRLILLGSLLGIAGIVLVSAFGSHLLRAIYGVEYAQESPVFVWIMLDAAIAYVYVFVGTGVSAMRRFTIQLPIHLASTLALVIACFLLIDRFGMKGAAWSMAIGGIVEAVGYSIVLAKLFTDHSAEQEVRNALN
jgi:O-antigen/teichoic acid export membrane protein